MPNASEFRLGDLRNTQDPYALLEEARTRGAVQEGPGHWLIFGHAEATEVLRSSATRSGFIADVFRQSLPAGAARDEMAHRINFLDPPDHTRVRRLVGKAFTPRRTTGLRPFIASLARELLEKLPSDEPIDLVRSFAHEVPSLVISELLGVPTDNRHRLTLLADRVSRLLSLGGDERELADAVEAAEEMHATLRQLVAARRAKPEDDLLSALLAAEDAREKLSEVELLSLAATLYSAGHRTTRDLFSNGLTALLSEPGLVAEMQSGTLPLAAVVEEFLRYETPTHIVQRMLSEPLDVGGQTIRAGEPIAIVIAAANRDPEVYYAAERFDPRRWACEPAPPPPLSFALGAHFCIGANLARLEVGVMLEALFEMFPNVRLSDDALKWHHTGVFRGVDALPVILGLRSA